MEKNMNLHLHAHLKESILDYGPVYSFWLFAFERLNGILGSYHTNCHDISLQLMRKFLSATVHGIHKWPAEFKGEFSSLLCKHEYNKGSLQASSFEQALQVHEHKHIIPLPPIHEAAWERHEKGILCDLLSSLGHNDCGVLTLYEKATALSIGGFIIGSSCSKFVTKAHVMAVHPKIYGKLSLAKIEHFAKLDFLRNNDSEVSAMWTACASFYDEHLCKSWFGGPTEVWTQSIYDTCYISISLIKCQVAICETEVDTRISNC